MAKNKTGRKFKNSLEGRVVAYIVVFLFVLVTMITVISTQTISASMAAQEKQELERDYELITAVLNGIDPGKYRVVVLDEDKIVLCKGKIELAEYQKTYETLKKNLGIDISFFYKDLRMITTISDEEGNVYSNTLASQIIVRDVLNTGRGHFYDDAEIFGKTRYVLYQPVINNDGTVFGMIAVSKSAEAVEQEVRKAVVPIISLCAFATLMLAFISMFYMHKLIEKLEKIRYFMKAVSQGDFVESVDSNLLKADDELGDLARAGVEMQKSIRKLVEQDALTGLNNRRYGNARLEQLRDRFIQSGYGFGLCICDIDFFKKVNDTYGHDNGDEVLKMVASVLKKNMGGKGFAVRWGGEEFLLIFDSTDYDKNVEVLENILQQIRETTVETENAKINVTMTFGVTQAILEESVDETLKRADELLYSGKTNGRNRVVRENVGQ